MKYVPPGEPGSIVSVKPRYENFIAGKWLAATQGKYRVDLSPAPGRPITWGAQSTAAEVARALDAADAANDGWGGAPGSWAAGGPRLCGGVTRFASGGPGSRAG